MLSSHSPRRDHKGLPVVVRKRKGLNGLVGRTRTGEQLVAVQNWNASHESLCSVVESLRDVLDRIEFLEVRVLHDAIKANSPGALACNIKALASVRGVLVEDEITRLEDRYVLATQRFDEILCIARLVVRYSLQIIPDDLTDATTSLQLCEPRTLIRMFGQSSHTGYSINLGFYCSNWKLSKPVKSLSDLQKNNKLFEQGLRNHCEGSNPSDWISLIDNIPKALDFIEKWNFDKDPTCKVALVSIAKLNRLNIICEPSDYLVKLAGAHCYSGSNQAGVQFAWSNHYLVHEWIPAECTLKVFDLNDFLRVCTEHNFQKGRLLQKKAEDIVR
jgi:hypothetical protein